jgi:hypothetical protein
MSPTTEDLDPPLAAETRKESPVAVQPVATTDLPDPLQTLDDDTAADADALLRQLAGDEVDRLLTEPASSKAPDTALPPRDDRQAFPTPVDPLTSPASAAADAPESRGDAEFSAKPIDRPSEPPAPEPPAPEPPAAEPPPTATTTTAEDKSPTIETADARSPTVRQDPTIDAELVSATTTRSGEAPPAAAHLDSDLADAIAEQEQREILGLDRTPLLLRPLIWLNRPFEGLSEPTRELLGTVGLVTMVNALLVLLYVMLVRG